mgnify:CR=1 FL=1
MHSKMRRYEIVYTKSDNPDRCYKIIVFANSNDDAFSQYWKHMVIEETWCSGKKHTIRSIKKRYHIVESQWLDCE